MRIIRNKRKAPSEVCSSMSTIIVSLIRKLLVFGPIKNSIAINMYYFTIIMLPLNQ